MNAATETTTTEAPEAVPTRTEFKIPDPNLDLLRGEVDRLAKKAAKLGLAPVTMTVLSTVTEAAPTQKDPARVKVFHIVEVAGPQPRIEGYKLIAALDHGHATGNLVRGFHEVPVHYYTAANECQHCGRDITGRKYTVVLQDQAGKYMQVGLSCLRDFLGHGHPDLIAAFFEDLHDLCNMGDCEEEAWGEGGGGRRLCQDLTEFVALAVCAIRTKGWVPSRGDGESTRQAVYSHLYPSPMRPKAEQKLPLEAEDKEKATAAIAWAKALPEEPGQQYLWNLRLLAWDGYCDPKSSGLAASLAQAYQRHLNDEAAARRAALRPSEHVGRVGAEVAFAGTFLHVQAVNSYHGSCWLHKMEDAAGNVFVWFTNFQQGDPGGACFLVGTVKKHDDFRGLAQTVLTRCSQFDSLENMHTYLAEQAAKVAKKAVRLAKKAEAELVNLQPKLEALQAKLAAEGEQVGQLVLEWLAGDIRRVEWAIEAQNKIIAEQTTLAPQAVEKALAALRVTRENKAAQAVRRAAKEAKLAAKAAAPAEVG